MNVQEIFVMEWRMRTKRNLVEMPSEVIHTVVFSALLSSFPKMLHQMQF